jgi:hypothetical protein
LQAIDRARASPIADLLGDIEAWQGGESAQDDICIVAVELTTETGGAGQ